MKKDFSNYKVRASCLGKIMTPTKGKTNLDIYNELKAKRDHFQTQYDKLRYGLKSKDNYAIKIDAIDKELQELEPRKYEFELSSTAKAYLRQVYVEETFGREKEIESKYIDKGNLAEEDSISLITRVMNKFYVKNEQELSNDWVKGTPDILSKNPEDFELPDVKTKWDIFGFMEEDGDNWDYDWQLWCYCWLSGKTLKRLYYTLVNTPEGLIYSEWRRQVYAQGLDFDSQEATELEEKIRKNHTYDDIDPALRLKYFDSEFDESRIETVKRYVEKAREYLNSLSLNGKH